MEYVRLCSANHEGKPINKGRFIPVTDNPHIYIKDRNQTLYISQFIYNEEQKKKAEETNTISGITDVVTDKLFWDFDSFDDIDKAKADAQEMCARLMQHGIKEEELFICFSGKKGFSVEVKSNQRFKPEEIKTIASKMAEGLKTFDPKMYDSARVFRIPDTRHFETGLYKTPLTLSFLCQASVEAVKKEAAQEPNPDLVCFQPPVADIPQSILELKRTDTKDRITTATIVDAIDLDFKHKPKGFSNCKFAIMNGFFPSGSRHQAMLILAATCRANGFGKEIAYNICKAAARLQAQRHNSEPFPKEEIWKNIIEKSIYTPKWDGGQFTCKSDLTLKKICEGLGSHKCKLDSDSATVASDDVFVLFKQYAENYDKNALTTGIKPLDDKVNLLVGSSVAILAPPGVGKTSFVLSVLNHNSNKDISSIFFSYDMYHSLVYLRLVEKHFGIDQRAAFNLIRENPVKTEEVRKAIREQYKNVAFCFKSGQTPEDIDRTIVETEERTGKKIKIIAVDYSELVVAETSDPTQASAQVAQKMRQIANDRELCVVTLYQPTKHYSDPSEEARTYQAAKGSGAIAQAVTLMLGLSRPGFDPRQPEQDRFITISALKNRLGGLFSLDLGWDGLKGSIYEIDHDEQRVLDSIRQRRKEEKSSEESW